MRYQKYIVYSLLPETTFSLHFFIRSFWCKDAVNGHMFTLSAWNAVGASDASAADQHHRNTLWLVLIVFMVVEHLKSTSPKGKPLFVGGWLVITCEQETNIVTTGWFYLYRCLHKESIEFQQPSPVSLSRYILLDCLTKLDPNYKRFSFLFVCYVECKCCLIVFTYLFDS